MLTSSHLSAGTGGERGLGTCPAVAWGPGHVAPLLTLALSVPVTWWGWWWTYRVDSGHSRAEREGWRSEKAQWVRRRLSRSDSGRGLAEGFAVKLE